MQKFSGFFCVCVCVKKKKLQNNVTATIVHIFLKRKKDNKSMCSMFLCLVVPYHFATFV